MSTRFVLDCRGWLCLTSLAAVTVLAAVPAPVAGQLPTRDDEVVGIYTFEVLPPGPSVSGFIQFFPPDSSNRRGRILTTENGCFFSQIKRDGNGWRAKCHDLTILLQHRGDELLGFITMPAGERETALPAPRTSSQERPATTVRFNRVFRQYRLLIRPPEGQSPES